MPISLIIAVRMMKRIVMKSQSIAKTTTNHQTKMRTMTKTKRMKMNWNS